MCVESVSVCVCVCWGRGVENEEGREGILVRIDVEGSVEKNDKNEIEFFFLFAVWSFYYSFYCIFNPCIFCLIEFI